MKVRLILVLSMSALPLSGQQAAQRRINGDRAWSWVAVQPIGNKCPAEAPEPPALAISSNDFVKLERSFPAYTVRIHADGRVVWQRKMGAQLESPVSKRIQPEDARAFD